MSEEPEDDEQASQPISRRVRRVRGKIKKAKAKNKARKLKKQRARQRRKEKIKQKTQPVRDEFDATVEELGKLKEEFVSTDDKSEQAEEQGGSFLANVLGAPSQVGDFDGDGDDDLALFFGVDGEEEGRDGPDPFAAFEDEEQRQRPTETEDGAPFTELDGDVFTPVAEFEEQFEPVVDPFEDNDEQ